jgi:hypothetical protein
MFNGETQGVTSCWTLWRWGESCAWVDRRGVPLLVLLTPFGICSVDTVRRGAGRSVPTTTSSLGVCQSLKMTLVGFPPRQPRKGVVYQPNQVVSRQQAFRTLDFPTGKPPLESAPRTDILGRGRVYTSLVSCWTTTLERHAYAPCHRPP